MVSESASEEAESIGLGCALEFFKEYDEVQSLINRLKDVYNDQSLSEATYQRFLYILNQYQEQPHLLDSQLEKILEQLLSVARNVENEKQLQHLAFRFLYIITKVRGYKVVLRHLPHEVTDVESVLSLLSEQDPQDCNTWETRYMLLLWMSIIVMIPFHMARLDDTSGDADKKKTVMERILDVIKLYLSVGDKARDAAAFLSSRFITRPDVKSLYLAEYLDWSLQMLVNSDSNTLSGLSLQAGTLSSLALLFKLGKREDVKDYGVTVLTKILECGFKDSKSSTVRKMSLKLIQRIGLSFLRMKVASWRYSRGTRSLTDNLAKNDNVGGISSVPSPVKNGDAGDDDDNYDIPDETEDVIEQLLVGLRDKDTIIRWSAAKGIGRVTGRLPKELADDVVTSVLELFSLRESDSAWHGGCLALAELGRRGLILPQHLGKVVCVVLKALIYDELRGNFSVGAHIRDAACYVCWAFARAYEPTVLQPYVNNIAGALLITTVFDREVNCRRAASAAFQENVGRQGTFPHGIDILTTVDYYAVGSRQNAFLNLSVYIGQFPEYTLPLIDHLIKHKINHWDTVIRELSAKALHNLTSNDPEYMSKEALPVLILLATGIDLHSRHGSILAIGEIMHALSDIAKKEGKDFGEYIDMSTLKNVRNIVFMLSERKWFRGLGGVLMRVAMCSLIEKASIAGLPFSDDDELIVEWKEILDSCLQHIEVGVRSAAVSALPFFCKQYYPPENPHHSKFLEDMLLQLKANQLEVRCGYALAVGSLPCYMLKGHVPEILSALAECSSLTTEHSNWAEARRDAIKALSQVATTVGIDNQGNKADAICQENMSTMFESFLSGMEDYTIDSRGEVGAIVREAAMQAIQDVTLLIALQHPEMLSEELVRKMFCALLQQCIEKIDRTRSVAGSVFTALLHSDPEVPHIPCRQALLEEFPLEVCQKINWASPGDTFSHFAQLLKLDTYLYSLLLGFTVSVGGLTESLVKYSRSALVSCLSSIQSDEQVFGQVCDTLICVLQKNLQNDRILIPFFKMMDHLLTSGISFPDDSEDSFPRRLLNLSWQATFKSGDPQKLLAAVDLFCDLLQFSEPCRKKALSQLTIFLCHRFPRVRKCAASKLYEAFLSYETLPDSVCDEVMEILTETDWNEPVDVLRPIRNNLCEIFGIPPPILKSK